MSSTQLLPGAVHPDTRAVLLLCGTFARSRGDDPKPLTPSEYNAIALWLGQQGRRPASLLQPGEDALPREGPGLPDVDRLRALLERGFQMAAALESWQRLGLWVISRGEECYPERLRRQLRAAAPALLYGAGDLHRLNQGGLAVVGSRDIDDEGIDFTRRVAEHCADQKVPIISGGARGVDRAAVATGLAAGGSAVVVLAEHLDRAATARDTREALRDGRLVLVTPYEPEASFTIGRAMGRNKLIYALADHALVVRVTANEGGTWAGAVEQLNRNRSMPPGVPVFIRTQHNPRETCQELRSRGAFDFPEDDFWHGKIAEELTAANSPPPAMEPAGTPSVSEDPPDSADAPPPTPPPDPTPASAETCYQRCLPLLLQSFQQEKAPKQLSEIAKQLDLLPRQLDEWVKRAVAEGKLLKKKQKGRMVYMVPSAAVEPSLFDGDGDAA